MEIKISIIKEKLKKIFAIIIKVYYIILPIVIIGMIFALIILDDKIKSVESSTNYNTFRIHEAGHALYDSRSVGGKFYTYFEGYSYTLTIYNKERTPEGTTFYCRFTNHYSIARSKITLTPKILINPEPDTWYNQPEVNFEFDENKFANYKVELWNIGPGQSVNFTIYLTSKMRDGIRKQIDEACKKKQEFAQGYDCNNIPVYVDFYIESEKI